MESERYCLKILAQKKKSPAAQLHNDDIDANPCTSTSDQLFGFGSKIQPNFRTCPPFCLIFPIFFSDKKSRKVMKFKAGRRSVGELLRDRLDGHHVSLVILGFIQPRYILLMEEIRLTS